MNFSKEIIKVAKDLKADSGDIATLYFNISDFISSKNVDNKTIKDVESIISSMIYDEQKTIVEKVGKQLAKNKRFLSILEENNLKSQFV